MVLAVVRSKPVILLAFIHCIGCAFLLYGSCVLSSLANILLKNREQVVLLATLIQCVVVVCFLAFPHGVLGWSAVCDCDIFWSYSLEPRHMISNNVVFRQV